MLLPIAKPNPALNERPSNVQVVTAWKLKGLSYVVTAMKIKFSLNH